MHYEVGTCAEILPSSFVRNSRSKDGVHLSNFVIDWVYLPKFQGLFIAEKARNVLFGSKVLNFDVVALRIDFSHPRLPVPREGIAHCPLANVGSSCSKTFTNCGYRFPGVSHLLSSIMFFHFIL